VLIIWDKLLGTFEPEVETVRYGVTKPVNSFNPIVVTFQEWKAIFKDLRNRELNIKEKVHLILSPPSD
ncbi:sterol desaturase family protein, partial [Vibrio sp. 10N.261.45.A7]